MWGEALRLLDDVAAGKVDISCSASAKHVATNSTRLRKQPASSGVTVEAPTADQPGAGEQWPREYRLLDKQTNQADQDTLWHVVMRKLWEQRAADSLLNDFLQRMSPEQLQRFKVLYNLRPAPGGGYTMQPLEDWQVSADSLKQISEQQQPRQDSGLENLAFTDAQLTTATEAA